MPREVTERDFRAPEFRDARVDDYEFRDDGKIVRKDRWEMGIQRIRELVGLNVREFEIPEVIDAVRRLVADKDGWISIGDDDEAPAEGDRVRIRLSDGSELRNVVCEFVDSKRAFRWPGGTVDLPAVTWREEYEEAPC